MAKIPHTFCRIYWFYGVVGTLNEFLAETADSPQKWAGGIFLWGGILGLLLQQMGMRTNPRQVRKWPVRKPEKLEAGITISGLDTTELPNELQALIGVI